MMADSDEILDEEASRGYVSVVKENTPSNKIINKARRYGYLTTNVPRRTTPAFLCQAGYAGQYCLGCQEDRGQCRPDWRGAEQRVLEDPIPGWPEIQMQDETCLFQNST